MADPPLAARRGYHHGNLREALLDAARQLVAERGPLGFTLAEAARRAGVSPSAPYRHFKDRDEVLAELCRRGFVLFGERLQAAAQSGATPEEALMRMGPAYLRFAREEPGYYAAMFAFQAPGEAPGAAGEAPFATLAGAIGALLPKDGRDPRLVALQVWALSHGVAMLERAGLPAPALGAPSAETVLETGVAALLAGSESP
ncbi:TetR/AcrR family transcriptional regulator [Siccirubricoccus sp. KC 17139]|uniref:TetR/AcrR family transcriptional regulator n=1 Tax=Siccirubricoccus soli TaxID=2899147 RepID=A0ABT1DCP7_9PROT|nr:TetR/AcrR family transcriptional regulator [Siccirubricoccus soli]MCO6419707.1 TetR/AcrR family transcriptional regulator [Siccirubricoccus soli]MCP2685842.1 TetR/AcrR family transcriptional regulator [Siccirubricoccus soli]